MLTGHTPPPGQVALFAFALELDLEIRDHVRSNEAGEQVHAGDWLDGAEI